MLWRCDEIATALDFRVLNFAELKRQMAMKTTNKLGGPEAGSSLSEQCPPDTLRVEFTVTWHQLH